MTCTVPDSFCLSRWVMNSKATDTKPMAKGVKVYYLIRGFLLWESNTSFSKKETNGTFPFFGEMLTVPISLRRQRAYIISYSIYTIKDKNLILLKSIR